MTVQADEDIERWLQGHEGWTRDGNAIARAVECASFPAAIGLVTRVAEVAEDRDHHPDIDIRWRTVRFALSTHSAGGITEKDLDLAATIDDLAAGSGG
jgi:4a-hydroxytetrahydrobiopterin dehydratase